MSQETKAKADKEAIAERRERYIALHHGERKVFRCGLRKGAPFHYVTLGGFTFSSFTYAVKGAKDPVDTERTKINGALYSLTKGQHANILSCAGNKVARAKTKHEWTIITKDSPYYMPEAGDVPLVDLIYMKQVSQEYLEALKAPELEADGQIEEFGVKKQDKQNKQEKGDVPLQEKQEVQG